MTAIVMLLVLASPALADEYTPDDNIEIVEHDGKFGVKLGNLVNLGCIKAELSTVVNNVAYVIRSSKWQIRADESDSWADVPETATVGLCGLAPTLPGEYRWVANTSRGKIASGNTLVVAGDAEAGEDEGQETDESAGDATTVEAAPWGAIKAAQQ